MAHSDCNVPKCWAEDPRLGNWVHTQRTRKRRLDRGERSDGMTVEWAARLTALGFVWEGTKAHLNEAKWEAQLARLADYKVAHGDCDVPNRYVKDKVALGLWVADQRQHKNKLARGEPCKGMTAERVARLTALGFAWALY